MNKATQTTKMTKLSDERKLRNRDASVLIKVGNRDISVVANGTLLEDKKPNKDFDVVEVQ